VLTFLLRAGLSLGWLTLGRTVLLPLVLISLLLLFRSLLLLTGTLGLFLPLLLPSTLLL
jgi:hypothetical protein